MSPTTSANSTSPGLTAVPGKLVNVPRVGESPVSFECKLSQIIQLQGADGEKAQAWLTLGEVVAVYIDKAFIKDGVYQTALAHPIVRAGRQRRLFRDPPGRHVRDGGRIDRPRDVSCRASPRRRICRRSRRINFASFQREVFTKFPRFALG